MAENEIYAYDIGPGNCLIDSWIKKAQKKYDEKGLIARSGKTDQLILNQALENFNIDLKYEKSLDVKILIFFYKRFIIRKWRCNHHRFYSKTYF